MYSCQRKEPGVIFKNEDYFFEGEDYFFEGDDYLKRKECSSRGYISALVAQWESSWLELQKCWVRFQVQSYVFNVYLLIPPFLFHSFNLHLEVWLWQLYFAEFLSSALGREYTLLTHIVLFSWQGPSHPFNFTSSCNLQSHYY